MASRRSIKRVPTFTERQIVLADLCARDLWEGTNFENGKSMEKVLQEISESEAE